MLPATIWVGPFCTSASIRPGGSGWITALIVPPSFGSCARANVLTLLRANANTSFFNISFPLGA